MVLLTGAMATILPGNSAAKTVSHHTAVGHPRCIHPLRINAVAVDHFIDKGTDKLYVRYVFLIA